MDLTIFPIAILFVVSLVAAILHSTLQADYAKKEVKHQSQTYRFSGFVAVIAAVVLFMINGFKFDFSWYSFLLGIAFGLVAMASTVLLLVAIKKGPYGYTTVIVNFSTAITALSGFFIFGQSISVFSFIGIALILLSFFFTIDTSNKDGKKANLSWLIVCIFALIASAALGILQVVHQTSEHKDELLSFLMVTFIVDAIVSFSFSFVYGRTRRAIKKELEKDKFFTKKFVTFGIICGICMSLNYWLNTYLSSAEGVSTAMFFPIVNGVPLMAAILISFVFFKEKLSKKQIAGLIIGVLAIVLLGLPIADILNLPSLVFTLH